MDARLGGAHGLGAHGVVRLLVAAVVALALVLTLEAIPAAAASPKACRVKDLGTGRSYTTLQAAVDAAKPGARLTVRGTCVGATVISRKLTILGVKTKRSGKPKLSGGRGVRLHSRQGVRVLYVEKGVRVKLRGLEILRGQANRGAGIFNRGNLILTDVQVRRCLTSWQLYGDGGGVYNAGRLVLNDKTRIADNYSGRSGGVSNEGTLILNGASAIADNDSYAGSAGVGNQRKGTLILNGASAIAGNLSAYHAGGVGNWGRLVMNGSSTISKNSTWEEEGDVGGVYNGRTGRATMNDASSLSGNEVGAVENLGTFTMNDTSTITGNAGYWSAAARQSGRGRFTMHDASSIRGNTNQEGSGGGMVLNGGRFRMTGTSTITGNTAPERHESEWGNWDVGGGGGIYKTSGTLVGVTCGPGGNVHGNTPDDCYFN